MKKPVTLTRHDFPLTGDTIYIVRIPEDGLQICSQKTSQCKDEGNTAATRSENV